jgi:hypothetical protein
MHTPGLTWLSNTYWSNNMGWFSKFFNGTPEKHERISTLRKEQEPVYGQLTNAAQQQGAGGAFGDAADYYRNLMSDNPEDLKAFAAPELRRFNEETIPGLSEQFAGMGAGGLSSSGFRNAAVNANTDLSERLGQIRANLRMQGAQGLQDIGKQALGNYSQDVTTDPGSEGLVGNIGNAAASFLSPAAGPIFNKASSLITNTFGSPKVGKNSSPYGNPSVSSSSSGSLPSFNPRLR